MKKEMRRYPSKPRKNFRFTQFKIVVPTEKDKKEIMDAFQYLHNCDIDTDYVTVNQLVHQYIHGDESDKYLNIIVDEKLYETL